MPSPSATFPLCLHKYSPPKKKAFFSFYFFQAIGLFRHPLNSVVVGTIGKTISFGQGCLIEQVWLTHSHMELLGFSTPWWCPTTPTRSCSSTCFWSWPPAASLPSLSLPASPLLLLKQANRRMTSCLCVTQHLERSTLVLWNQSKTAK